MTVLPSAEDRAAAAAAPDGPFTTKHKFLLQTTVVPAGTDMANAVRPDPSRALGPPPACRD
jgi:hypothetical protein